MQIRPTFKLREIEGETIVVNQGKPDADLTRIISLNSSARWLWQFMSGKDFTSDAVAIALVEHYGISEELAKRDAAAWIDSLRNCGIIE